MNPVSEPKCKVKRERGEASEWTGEEKKKSERKSASEKV
jgi:hypothetical protein